MGRAGGLSSAYRVPSEDPLLSYPSSEAAVPASETDDSRSPHPKWLPISAINQMGIVRGRWARREGRGLVLKCSMVGISVLCDPNDAIDEVMVRRKRHARAHTKPGVVSKGAVASAGGTA